MKLLLVCLAAWLTCASAQEVVCEDAETLECWNCFESNDENCEARGSFKPCVGPSPSCKYTRESDNGNLIAVFRNCEPDSTSSQCPKPIGETSCNGGTCFSCGADQAVAQCTELCPDGNQEFSAGFVNGGFEADVVKGDGSDSVSARDALEGSGEVLKLDKGDEIEIVFVQETQVNGLLLETKCARKITFKCFDSVGALIIDPPITAETSFTNVFGMTKMIPQPAELGVLRMTISFDVDEDCDNGQVSVKDLVIIMCVDKASLPLTLNFANDTMSGAKCREEKRKTLDFNERGKGVTVNIKGGTHAGENGDDALDRSGKSVFLTSNSEGTDYLDIILDEQYDIMELSLKLVFGLSAKVTMFSGSVNELEEEKNVESDGSVNFGAGVEGIDRIRLDFGYDTGELSVKDIQIVICAECREENMITKNFNNQGGYSVAIDGPSSSDVDVEDVLDKSGKSIMLASNSEGIDKLVWTFDQPTEVLEVMVTTQFSDYVKVTFFDLSDKQLYTATNEVSDVSTKEKSRFTPEGVIDVKTIVFEFGFEDSGEIRVKDLAVMICDGKYENWLDISLSGRDI